MQLPNSPRTRETERLMLLWRHENPTADTAAYNAQYVRTYASLTGFSDKEDQPQRVFVVTRDPRAVKTPPPKYALHPGRRAPKHRAQTKGAFGKPKHLRRQ